MRAENMIDWGDRLGLLLLDASVAVALLFTLATLAIICCHQPVRRIAIARAALVCALCLVPLSLFSPVPRLPLDHLVRSLGVIDHPILSYSWSPERPSAQRHARIEQKRRLAQSAEARPGSPSRAILKIPRWALAAYLAGMLLSLAWLLFGYAGLSWLRTRSIPASERATELLRSLPLRGRSPDLRISLRVNRPVLVGLLRQTILIPRDLDDQTTTDELRLSLLHELVHSQRRDPWFAMAGSLAHCFWFFLPPLWWVRSQMRLDQEFMADQIASRAYGPDQAYASSLVKIASDHPAIQARSASSTASTATAPPASPDLRPSALILRVLMLVKCPFVIEDSPPRWWYVMLVTVASVVTPTLSSLTFQIPSKLENPPNRSVLAHPSEFRMSRLTIEPIPRSDSPTRLYTIPIELPDSFLLEFEIWSPTASLAQMKVAGLALNRPSGPTASEQPFSPPLSNETWHHILIDDQEDRVTVTIDPVQNPSFTTIQEVTTHLSFEVPARATVHVRNLRLSW